MSQGPGRQPPGVPCRSAPGLTHSPHALPLQWAVAGARLPLQHCLWLLPAEGPGPGHLPPLLPHRAWAGTSEPSFRPHPGFAAHSSWRRQREQLVNLPNIPTTRPQPLSSVAPLPSLKPQMTRISTQRGPPTRGVSLERRSLTCPLCPSALLCLAHIPLYFLPPRAMVPLQLL